MLDFEYLERTFYYRDKITGIDLSTNDFEDISVVFYDLIDCIFYLNCLSYYFPNSSKSYSVRVWLGDGDEFKVYPLLEFLEFFKGGSDL